MEAMIHIYMKAKFLRIEICDVTLLGKLCGTETCVIQIPFSPSLNCFLKRHCNVKLISSFARSFKIKNISGELKVNRKNKIAADCSLQKRKVLYGLTIVRCFRSKLRRSRMIVTGQLLTYVHYNLK